MSEKPRNARRLVWPEQYIAVRQLQVWFRRPLVMIEAGYLGLLSCYPNRIGRAQSIFSLEHIAAYDAAARMVAFRPCRMDIHNRHINLSFPFPYQQEEFEAAVIVQAKSMRMLGSTIGLYFHQRAVVRMRRVGPMTFKEWRHAA